MIRELFAAKNKNEMNPMSLIEDPAQRLNREMKEAIEEFNLIDGTKPENYQLVDASIFKITSLEKQRANLSHPEMIEGRWHPCQE